MCMRNIIQWMILGILFIFVVFTVYTSIKMWWTFRKESKLFLEQHHDAEFVKDSDLPWILEIILGIFAVGLGLFSPWEQLNPSLVLFYNAGYVCVGFLFFGIAFDNYVHKRAIFTKDGFFFVNEMIRYRSIRSVEPKKRWFGQKMLIHMANGEEMEISYKIGERVKEGKDLRKKQKKERHK